MHPLAPPSFQGYICHAPESCWLLLQAYAISSFEFDIKLYRSNRPPHSAVRAPGKFQSPLIMEHIIEHVAARLDMDPVRVREINFMKAPVPGTYHTLFRRSLSFCAFNLALHFILCFIDRNIISPFEDDWPNCWFVGVHCDSCC